jgi:hypothetical protein
MPAARLQTASMPNVLIRELPAEAHVVLSRRAKDAGMSLQKYLVRKLTRSALTPTMTEFFDSFDTTDLPDLSRQTVLEAVHEGRPESCWDRRLRTDRRAL